LIGRYWFENWRDCQSISISPRSSDTGSRRSIRTGLALFISQSGETADTLASLRYCQNAGQKIGRCGQRPDLHDSRALPTTFCRPLAVRRSAVASTKAFTCQLTVLLALAINAARQRGAISEAKRSDWCNAAIEMPRHAAHVLKLEPQIEALAKELSRATDVLYLGRGTSYPLALEGRSEA
jgi:glucosamine--fructose-6-phosphate aminotransferase (isomerizing)